MKKVMLAAMLLGLSCMQHFAISQTLGPYTVYDYMGSASHPNGCNTDYVTNWPDDSIWVNFSTSDVATGSFMLNWTDQPGDDLLLETGYHEDNWVIRLALDGGGYSAYDTVRVGEWTYLGDVDWYFTTPGCVQAQSFTRSQFYKTMDFDTSFGLSPSDVVVGVEVTFQFTSGGADLAGVYIIVPPVPLPVDPIEFSAEVTQGNLVKLDWSTIGEIGFGEFELERSGDGNYWESFKKREVVHSNQDWINYSDIDPTPQSGTSYYRIKMIGENGKFNYSEIAEVVVNPFDQARVFPNPTSGSFVFSNVNFPATYQLVDITGKEIQRGEIKQNTAIDITHLNPGVYFIHLEEEAGSQVIKLLKQ